MKISTETMFKAYEILKADSNMPAISLARKMGIKIEFATILIDLINEAKNKKKKIR